MSLTEYLNADNNMAKCIALNPLPSIIHCKFTFLITELKYTQLFVWKYHNRIVTFIKLTKYRVYFSAKTNLLYIFLFG